MNAHYLQHVPFEGLASIAPWLTGAGFEISSTQLYRNETLPTETSIDFLVIMGGPMGVSDEAIYPWLAAEKAFIRRYIATGKPVLGICLGAQLIASALGAKVYTNPHKEIGWFPIFARASRDTQADMSIFSLPAELSVFHWHGDTFDIPNGGVALASSHACEHQGFQWGNSVIGLQCHLESTPESVSALVENCRNELTTGTFVQPEQRIMAEAPVTYNKMNQCLAQILTFLSTQT